MKNKHFLILSFFVLVFFGCIGAGNIGKIVYIPSNLSNKCIEVYADDIFSQYEVPDSLKHHLQKYSHINVKHFFFSDYPRSIYRVTMHSSCAIISVYNLEDEIEFNRKSNLSSDEIKQIEDRFSNKILRSIWLEANRNNMPDSLMYIFKDEKYFLYETQ